MTEDRQQPPHPWTLSAPSTPPEEFTLEWTPPDDEVIAPGAFAAAVGKPVRVNSPTGTQIGTLVSAEVNEDGTAVRLTVRGAGEQDPG